MVKALHYGHGSCGEGDAEDFAVLQPDGSGIPSVLGSSSFNASKHGWSSPCFYPLVHAGESDGGPSAIEHWQDEEDSVGKGTSKLGGVLG